MSQFDDIITVALVEDHVALRQGIELVLSRRGHVIAGAADDASGGYELIRAKRPDVALVDVGLPDESGATLAHRLLQEDPGQRILLYTGLADLEAVAGALQFGVRGLVHKASSPEELTSAIRIVADGGTYMDRRLGSTLPSDSATERSHELSPREREVLELLTEGLSGAQAAKQLFISPDTARTHVRNAMGKLGARTRVQAITIALQQNEIVVAKASPGVPDSKAVEGADTRGVEDSERTRRRVAHASKCPAPVFSSGSSRPKGRA